MSLIYSVGHSTRSFPEFFSLLRANDIDVLIDVRRYPGSRRFPHFNRENLSQPLRAENIEYIHAPDLGGRRSASADSPNLFWRNAAFRAYADYMSTPEFNHELERILQLAETRRPAVMCAEAVPWRCHRQLIADALVARGHIVRHILTETRSDEHVLNPGAVVLPNGGVLYPAERDEQPTLFEGGAAQG